MTDTKDGQCFQMQATQPGPTQPPGTVHSNMPCWQSAFKYSQLRLQAAGTGTQRQSTVKRFSSQTKQSS